nr:MAG TPA: hypothetical protein [Caudoviricetes sp.]
MTINNLHYDILSCQHALDRFYLMDKKCEEMDWKFLETSLEDLRPITSDLMQGKPISRTEAKLFVEDVNNLWEEFRKKTKFF